MRWNGHKLVAVGVAIAWLAGQSPAAASPASADWQTISRGAAVDLEAHRVSRKYTLFAFSADWCGACRQLEPRLRELAGQFSGRLAVRVIDIDDWDSPVARQHDIGSVPSLILIDDRGGRVASGAAQLVLSQLLERLGPSAAGGAAAATYPTGPAASVKVPGVQRRGPGRDPASRPQIVLPAMLVALTVTIGAALWWQIARRGRDRDPRGRGLPRGVPRR